MDVYTFDLKVQVEAQNMQTALKKIGHLRPSKHIILGPPRYAGAYNGHFTFTKTEFNMEIDAMVEQFAEPGTLPKSLQPKGVVTIKRKVTGIAKPKMKRTKKMQGQNDEPLCC